MAVHEILKMGDARLLRVAPPVPASSFNTPELNTLISDMFETMAAAQGAGLAAPQTVLINPVITPISDEMVDGSEGCLSVPGMRGVVSRYSRIRYTGFDQYGKAIDREADGFHARVVQHECDHLMGMLYLMRIKDFRQFGFTSVLYPDLNPADDD
jgi:peptide deformylase